MRPDLAQRLQKVAKVLQLLKKIALSEAQFIDRASKRSLLAMQKAVERFEAALTSLSQNQKANEAVMVLLEQIVGHAGVVNQEVADSKKPFDFIKLVNQTAMPLAGAAARLMNAAFMAGRMQNADRVELAKADPRYKDNFFRAQEKLTEALNRMDSLIREIKPADMPQPPKEEPKDTSAVEGLSNQINEAHGDMLKTVRVMAKALVDKVRDLFEDDVDLIDALEQNIIAAMPGGEPGQSRKVNEKLNRDRDFYRDVLELQRGSSYDLGEFLNTKNKKLVYQAYRSLVMAMRALGVMQWAKARPDAVAKSKKALDLIIKAQQILKKRKNLVVDRLQKLQPEEDEEEEERGVPKGTFQESFDKPPAGAFSDVA